MVRLFADYKIEENAEFSLNKEDSRYISSVLRMREGEELTVVDADGFEVLAQVASLSKDEVVLHAVSKSRNETESPCKITLYQSISKGERMDLTIQKSVELGVYRIVPVYSSRCVAKPGKEGKIDRWQKIALEASRQSHRGLVPEVKMREEIIFSSVLPHHRKSQQHLLRLPFLRSHRCGQFHSAITEENKSAGNTSH